MPVDETGVTKLGFRQFDMPDGFDGWKFSAPDLHNAYVHNIDTRLDGQLKPLVRLVKAWKYKRAAPIKSFYLELRTAHYANTEPAIVYGIDLRNIFARLLADRLADFPDPRFPHDSFTLKACNTDVQALEALTKLANAARWSAEAMDAHYAGRTHEAFERWSLVFNGDFPQYSVF